MKTRSRAKVVLNSKASSSVSTSTQNVKKESAAPTDHYTIKKAKGEENDGKVIGFVLSGNSSESSSRKKAEKFEIAETKHENKPDATNSKTKEAGEYVCRKCNKSFDAIHALQRHMQFCVFNSAMAARRNEMMKNLNKIEKEAYVMEKKDICFCCGDSYKACHVSGHINCTDCPKTFKTQYSLERHIFLIHSENKDFLCSTCNARIRTASLLRLHKQQHEQRGKPYACKHCGRDFAREYHLKRHQDSTVCGGDKEDVATCNVCGKTFNRLDNLRTHLRGHLKDVPKTSEYTCPCCKRLCKNLSALKIHVRTHTGERPFNCDLCEKSFPSLISLKKHRRYHTGEKPYSCSVCSQRFVAKEVLNRHMKRHTGEKPHGCSECGKRFIQATQLKNHLKTHVRPFECVVCPGKFRTQRQLQIHAKHHSNGKLKGDVQFACKVCKQHFVNTRALILHRKSKKHFDIIKKTCCVCCKELPGARSLHLHMLKEHKPPDEKDDNTQQIKETKKEVLNSRITMDEDSQQSDSTDSDRLVIEEFIIDALPAAGADEDLEILPDYVHTISNPIAILPHPDKIEKDEQEEELERLNDSSDINDTVNRLLDMLVDTEILLKFGWPVDCVENVLCKVIENCGHKLTQENYVPDYGTRMREYVKLLFTVVIQNDAIKELLNNYSIDEVIQMVLSSENED